MNIATPLIKFTECFGIDPNAISTDKATESYYIDKGINVDAFKRLMIKNDLDEYTFILLSYFTDVYFSVKDEVFENALLTIDEENEINKQYEVDLTKALLFLLEDKSTFNMSVSFNKSRSSITIQNELIVKNLANELYREFKRKDFNKVALTYQEAKSEMLSKEEFKNSVYVERNYGSPDEPDIHEVEFEEAIDDYAENSMKEVEITVEFLNNKLKNLTKKGKKKGAKIKNSRLAGLCEDLSFLKRIDKYLSQTETEYICDFPLTNDDCRFIYACLVLFNIIEDNSKFRSKTLPENYIRTILKQKKMDSWIEEHLFGAKLFGILDLRNKLHQ